MSDQIQLILKQTKKYKITIHLYWQKEIVTQVIPILNIYNQRILLTNTNKILKSLYLLRMKKFMNQ